MRSRRRLACALLALIEGGAVVPRIWAQGLSPSKASVPVEVQTVAGKEASGPPAAKGAPYDFDAGPVMTLRFVGDEVVVPTEAFDKFNELLRAGEITFSPAKNL